MLQTSTNDAWFSKRARMREHAYFEKVRNAETSYGIQLRKIAGHVGDLIKNYNPFHPGLVSELEDILNRYSQVIRPWAHATSARMIAEVSRRDETAWRQHSQNISRALHKEIQSAPIGPVVKQLQDDQVELITGIPIEAGRKVQEMAREAQVSGNRYENLVPEIQNQVAGMTKRRATLLARTETGKAATAIVRARAEFIGSYTYTWRTARDRDVRPMHRKLEGTVQRWDDPPIAETNGARHAPGEYPNCFPSSQIVDLSVSDSIGLFRILYDGILVNLKIGSEIVQATPNHPLLTNRGWVAAQFIECGDQIICVSKQHPRTNAMNKHESKVTFGELFNASLCCGIERREVGFGLNFHGDIINSDVDYIPIDQTLLDYVKAVGFENVSQFPLARANSGIGRSIVSGSFQIGEPDGSGFVDSFMGSPRVCIDPQFSEFLAEFIGMTSDGFSSLPQETPIFYHLSRVEDKHFSDFSGHVYTLETREGLYPVGEVGAIAKNCRCWPSPVIEDKVWID
jgi:SPP1 gp7 family putative phage head morphogenesis protein